MNDAKRPKSLNRNVADGKRQSENLKSCADNCKPSERSKNRLTRSMRRRRGLRPAPLHQSSRRSPHSGVPGGVECSADEAERLRREDVSEASGYESRPSGMERKMLIRPLPAELFSETMLQLG